MPLANTASAVSAVSASIVHRRSSSSPRVTRLMSYLPRGNLLGDDVWRRRHAIVTHLLELHFPTLVVFGLSTGHSPETVGLTMVPVVACLAFGRLVRHRRLKSIFTTAGLAYCSAALVGLSHGSIEAHFHFFIIIGFIALYQDWVPFLWDIVFTVLSHGIGSAFRSDLIFNHHAGMQHPWLWSLIHGAAVLAACVGVVLFWRTTEDEQQKSLALTREIGEAEIGRFTSELLVNLARRNQSMLYRQLDILARLEEKERDPDALAELFDLDHLATRIRRNAENLLVLSGEEPARVWSHAVPLGDVVRAAIAETEDLNRVGFSVDERLAIQGYAVMDVTHLLAELTENAVRFSPPGSRVTIRSTPDVRARGAWLLTVEDWGVGMPVEDLETTNSILATPRSADVASSNRLGLHVVARLANRHDIQVSLISTSRVGVTAVVLLPPQLFASPSRNITDDDPGRLASPVALGWSAPGAEVGEVAWSGRPPRGRGLEPAPPLDDSDAGGVRVIAMDPAPDPTGSAVLAGFSRRRPQANLAPQLRAGPISSTMPTVSPLEASRARDALSRYQASRQTALAANDRNSRR